MMGTEAGTIGAAQCAFAALAGNVEGLKVAPGQYQAEAHESDNEADEKKDIGCRHGMLPLACSLVRAFLARVFLRQFCLKYARRGTGRC